jgi:hypothetical protein
LGSHKNRICVLGVLDVDEFRISGYRPSCLTHEHISRHEAIELTRSFLYKSRNPVTGVQQYYFEAMWLDSQMNAISFHDPREWRIVQSGPMHTHQLVPIGR